MAEDPNHPWGSGATKYQWDPAIEDIIHRVLRRWPNVTANTYVCHPWCGWSRFSVDFWGAGGRGSRIPKKAGREIRHYLMNLPGKPYIRHTIFRHALWTSWGGYSTWRADDHSGTLRHLHVTYYRS